MAAITGILRLDRSPLPVDPFPGWSRRGALRATADCRIDNRDELCRSLGLGRPGNPGRSDVDLILAAYSRWGDRCPEKLIGDFAFVLWDGQRSRLFGARDPFGARPLLYTRSPRLFGFASDARALAGLTDPPWTVNPARIAHYLVPQLEGADPAATFFDGVFRLPPAHTISLTRSRMALRRYWEPGATATPRLGSDEEYVEAFRELFGRSVRCRLRRAERPASMLSGGVDSSSIVAFARQDLQASGGPRLHTFSAVSETSEGCAESRAIRSTAALSGLHAVFLRRDRLQPYVTEMEQRLDELGELFDVQMILPLLVYIAARRRGVRVLLDGIDGDCVASLEPGCLAWLLRQGRGLTAWREACGLARFYAGHYPPWASAWRLLARAGRSAFAPEPARRLGHKLRAGRRTEESLDGTIIDREFARGVDLRSALERLWSHGRGAAARSLLEWQARQIDHPHNAFALERYHRVASACSVEASHPFFDRRLVRFCLGLPFDQKLRNGWSKWIVRRSTEGMLPDEVRWRRGRWQRLGPAFTVAFLETQLPLLRDVVADGMTEIRDYVDVAGVRRSFRRFRTSRVVEDGERVWQAVRLVLWLRRVAASRLDLPNQFWEKSTEREGTRAAQGQ